MVHGVVAVGGCSSTGYTNIAEFYDVALGTWSFVPNMPTARDWLAAAPITAAAHPGALVVGGFVGNSTNLTTAEFYDAVSNSWTTFPPMPFGQHSLAAAAIPAGLGTEMVTVGGYTTPFTPFNLAQTYSPITNIWTRVADMPTGRDTFAASPVTIGGVAGMMVVGGWIYLGPQIGSTDFYNPVANSWFSLPAVPSAASCPLVGPAAAPVAVSGTTGVLVTGGSCSGTYLSCVEFYNPVANAWIALANMSIARAGHAAVAVSLGGIDGVLAMGGYGNGGGPLSSAEFYNPTTNSWTTVAPMNTSRAALAAAPLSFTVPTVTLTPTVTPTPPSPTPTLEPGAGGPPYLALGQNVWNPVSGFLSIHYAVGLREDVWLGVYDSAGEFVWGTEATNVPPQQDNVVAWDGRNERGQTCASGVYVVVMRLTRTRFFARLAVVR